MSRPKKLDGKSPELAFMSASHLVQENAKRLHAALEEHKKNKREHTWLQVSNLLEIKTQLDKLLADLKFTVSLEVKMDMGTTSPPDLRPVEVRRLKRGTAGLQPLIKGTRVVTKSDSP